MQGKVLCFQVSHRQKEVRVLRGVEIAVLWKLKKNRKSIQLKGIWGALQRVCKGCTGRQK